MESWMGAIARCPEGNCAQDPPKDSPSCLNRSDSSSHTKVLAMIGGYWNLITWVFSCEIARLLWGYWLTCISQWPMDGIATFSLRAVHLLEVWKHFPLLRHWGLRMSRLIKTCRRFYQKSLAGKSPPNGILPCFTAGKIILWFVNG